MSKKKKKKTSGDDIPVVRFPWEELFEMIAAETRNRTIMATHKERKPQTIRYLWVSRWQIKKLTIDNWVEKIYFYKDYKMSFENVHFRTNDFERILQSLDNLKCAKASQEIQLTYIKTINLLLMHSVKIFPLHEQI